MLRELSRVRDLLGPRLLLRWASLVPVAVAIAALESLAALSVAALIQLVTAPDGFAANPLQDFLRRDFSLDASRGPRTLALGVGVLFVLKAFLRLGENWLRERCAQDTSAELSGQVLRRWLAAPYERHLESHSSDQIRNAVKSVESITNRILSASITFASEALIVLAVLFVVVRRIDTEFLVAGAAASALLYAMLRTTHRYYERWGRQLHEIDGATLRTLQQSLGAAKEIKALGCEDHFAENFEAQRRAGASIHVRRGSLGRVPRIAVETFFVLGVCAFLFVSQDPARIASTLGVFVYAALRIMPSINVMVYQVSEIRFGRASVEALWRDWQALAPETEPEQASATLRFEDRIEFRDVAFRYTTGHRMALETIDLTIRRGESIGVIGPTGAGKSTLIDLLLGLLHPSRGSIHVDGVDLTGRQRAWRRHIGYVPQAISLIDDTIRANIAFGVAPGSIDESRLRRALASAQLEDFVDGLPLGLDTRIGERGIRLSGGERQRVAVARALYRDPDVLVFDEATAALDNETERALTLAIEDLQGQKTLIVVAHRLSTVRGCDRLVLLDRGRIAAIGSWDELLEHSPAFRRMSTVETSGS